MKIAIIGSGISGLVAAYKLYDRHDVTVFEANSRIGGHTHTVPVNLGDEEHMIDTGFIVFNQPNYPNFCALMEELGVKSAPTSMSFSVRCDRNRLEYCGSSLNQLFAQRRNLIRPSFYRMLSGILRFGREAGAIQSIDGEGPTVKEWSETNGYSREFMDHYLVPLGSALWSSPASDFMEFPVRFVIEFLANHSMLQLRGRPAWRVIEGGSYRYVEKLTAKFRDRIRLRCPVRAIHRYDNDVTITCDGGITETFDHVVLACHADQALTLLADPAKFEREVLRFFPYQKNDVILHTDDSVLPKSKRAWASWNVHIPKEDRGDAQITYNMNLLQNLKSKYTFCVSLNRSDSIKPESIIKEITYHHPLAVRGQIEARKRRHEFLNTNRTSYCGAYWGYGFHEDGVRSALEVCDALERYETPARSIPQVQEAVYA